MTNNTPSGTKKHHESTEPESHETAKMFFFLSFFFFFFFFFFRRATSNLRDSFTMVFAQNSSIFRWAVHQPIAFFQVWSHTRWFEPLTEELWLPLRCHFSSRVHMRTHHLATKCNYYLCKIAELEILLVCGQCLKQACDPSGRLAAL